MTGNYKYSVAIQCMTYNHSKYITDALNSFVMQETDFPYVILLVDDASTDGEESIILDYVDANFNLSDTSIAYTKETEYANIIYAQHKIKSNCFIVSMCLKYNHYQIGKKYEKLNYLSEWLDNCKYIALCEGDDFWIDPLKLQKQVNFLEANPEYSLCGTNGIIFWDNEDSYLEYFNNIIISQELKPNNIIGRWPFPTASLVYKASIIKDYPSWTKQVYSGDMTLILISMYKGRIYGMCDLTCMYRHSKINKSSVSNIADKQKRFVAEQQLLLYTKFNEYTNGLYENEVKKVVKKLKRDIRFNELRQKSNILALTLYPILYTRKALSTLKEIIKHYISDCNIHQFIVDKHDASYS